ncbi:MAG: exodeoxyribonuclease VII large subunit [Proteobacteria bacterium]|nr:exodeoxyribonuclease VII large subunit [Pseudomonadota bacterium]
MQPYSVSGLCGELQRIVESRYPVVLVEGEIVQAQTPASGHCYLTLGDRDARLSAIIFAGTLRRLRLRPEAGMRVVARGRLSFYPRRGQAQLIVNELAPAGEGAMAKELARRRERLMRDGLLDPRRKRELPASPRVVGVVTSLTGAALQDFLKVSGLRFPAAQIRVAPTLVQGPEAPPSIVQALDLLQEDGRSDVIVLTRGGGSKSDLMAFQDEYVARAVAGCSVPTISAVGHEIDTTLCDEVADAVAPTPSAAAVLALPDGVALTRRTDETLLGLQSAMKRRLVRHRDRVQQLSARLRSPADRVASSRKKHTDLSERLSVAMDRVLLQRRLALGGGEERLARTLQGPLRIQRERLEAVRGRLQPAMGRTLERRRVALERAEGQLSALSPTAVLQRGYAIVRGPDGKLVSSREDVGFGDRLSVRVSDGSLDVIVS